MATTLYDSDYRQEEDGTWTVDFSWAGVTLIKGLPTRELAEQISEALWEAHKAGGDSASYGY